MKDLTDVIKGILDSDDQDIIQENANTNGRTPIGQMSLIATEVSKEFNKEFLRSDIVKLHEDGFIHIHDFDYYGTGTTTCCQIPLGKVLKDGFTVGTCSMRPPNSIGAAMGLAAILLQANQNTQHGGQAYPNFDYDLAPYIEKTYKNICDKYVQLGLQNFEERAMADTEEQTFQACEAFVHNCNSMLSRNGMQVPFVSVNFGLDTSKWGRMLSTQLLKAQIAGLGHNETPIFPILILKMKKGINMDEGDPNYDIYQLGLECLSKRLFPNFQFVDTPFNIKGFDINNPDTHIATMGCRTRIFEDVTSGVNHIEGRGNLSFTSINLPMLAQKVKSKHTGIVAPSALLELYATELIELTALVCEQLHQRYEYQYDRPTNNFTMLYDSTWLSDGTGTKVGDRLKVGSLAVGYIGLAEALKILTGYHHGESENAQYAGLKLIKHMKETTDAASDAYGLNYSVIATPAEGLSGTSLRKFKKKYGHVYGVTDYDFFTNSNHVPVYYNISAKDKIAIEAPYHELTLGGHITYIEVDGDTQNNLEALDDIVKMMSESGVGYGSINVPLDRCRDCNTQTIIRDRCPICDSDNISRIRRITGYLVGDMDKWNTAKRDEEKNRVKHGKD